jgi:hypothetical protein
VLPIAHCPLPIAHCRHSRVLKRKKIRKNKARLGILAAAAAAGCSGSAVFKRKVLHFIAAKYGQSYGA